MKNKSKWIALLTTLLCLIPLLAGVLGGGESAHAADSVNVTLHKKKMDQFPSSSIENTGKEMSEFDRFEGLSGVTFTAWDISTDFYAALNAVLTGNETDAEYNAKAKQVMESFTLNTATATRVPGDQTTDANGNASFANLTAKNADGTYKVYYFEEHATPGVEIGSYKLILMLPLKDNGSEITNIHLYPKNKVEGDNPVKELVDEDGNPLQPRPSGAYDFEIGQQIHYRASFVIPSQIGDILSNGSPRYGKLEFADAVDQTGVKFEGIDQITMNGTAINQATFLSNATYTSVNTAAPFTGYAGFNIAMNLSGAAGAATANYLSDFAGQTIQIYYTVSFTEDTPVDLDINNEFSVTMNHDGGSDEVKKNDPVVPPVITGGKKFFKYEDGTTKQALAGAEFVVIKKVGGTDYYLKAEAESMTWTAVAANEDYANATKYTSGADGKFEVTGLEYGTYYLRETRAPDGFAKLTNDVTFTVASGSYNNAADLEIENVSKGGTLPSTGGMGILAFIVIGLGLMTAAIVRYRRVQFDI
ncbi:SpaH/EbpB family LPXTG-anchored major pilin [Enterococcus pseudoavium]|uniref:SpaH/EbpB family LPXTG-anchored major pilin n=1 Tax=Enterococcus pseudoavium TaxID=44007 RepID=A0ABU3FK50_9ENTE|nr:SpaH/EbpB family LPXTG-anchored major pilin [Enterococcus pseudoavium]MDT2753568.1 SpaH/EbpB family LPXTG-anchored major pilin [Enterococcus pseudoavium]MDT2771451.1 SpaH/EbpB family LPXTG-anchored major pilin [Enterococcus pseudoavium]